MEAAVVLSRPPVTRTGWMILVLPAPVGGVKLLAPADSGLPSLLPAISTVCPFCQNATEFSDNR